MNGNAPYNPLDKQNLGISVAEALLARKAVSLGKVGRSKGAGIYALYYSGDFPAYEEIAKRNREGKFSAPIYVGKAVPPGARKGGIGLGDDPGFALAGRLREHADSIRAAENLNIEDFHCRYLVVEDIWIPLGESLLIARLAPLWNRLIDGYGNHDPGKGRYNQLRSRWDVLHPGRPWALKCQARDETAEQIQAEVVEYLRSLPVPESDVAAILQIFDGDGE